MQGQIELIEQPLTANTTNFVSNMKLPVHRWFRYSAGYSAQWAEAMIGEHVEPGSSDVVLDPFVGSGTTLIAAQSAGIESVGVESQPFVARVARSKLSWSSSFADLEAAAGDVLRRLDSVPNDRPFEDEPALLQKCYSPESLDELRRLESSIAGGEAGEELAQLLWLALVAILRPVSHVGTAQWQYILPNKTKATVKTTREAFSSQIAGMVSDMATRQQELGTASAALLIEGDVRSNQLLVPSSTFVLTSPPYANNYDYADATRLEMTFLGEVDSWGDLKAIRKSLVHSCTQHMAGYDGIEALESDLLTPIRDDLKAVYDTLSVVRESRGGRKAYHSMIVGYFLDMAMTWASVRQSLRDGGTACYVVGDSAPYGVHVPVEQWLGRLAIHAGFEKYAFEKVRDRNTKWKNRKHRVPLQEGHLWVS